MFAVWFGALAVFAPDGVPLPITAIIGLGASALQVMVSNYGIGPRFVGVRAFQSSQIWFGAVAGAAGSLVLARMLAVSPALVGSLVAAFSSGLLVAVAQEVSAARGSASQTRRRAVVVGTGEEALEWIQLVDNHPEMGLDLIGCIGDAGSAKRVGLTDRWLGSLADLEHVVEAHNIEFPIVAITSFRRPALQDIVDRLLIADRDVAMSWGVGRLGNRRLKAGVLSHETLPIIRRQRSNLLARRIKRVFETLLAGVLLVLASPLLAIAALAVAMTSRGPVFFMQDRVGRGSEPFKMIKLRTMMQGAEEAADALVDSNERTGPLFKMKSDPRVTPVGRILRATSFDEIPQLINVLKGEMSLIGPRPALPSEAASFDPEHNARVSVRPGLTGLWQLEARANSSFAAYKRFDLHYLENWSLGLDLRIAIATAQLLLLAPIVQPIVELLDKREVDPTPPRVRVEMPTTSVRQQEPKQSSVEVTERIAVLGAGYVGLTQALGLTSLGHHVVCADVNPVRVAELRAGIPPILEEGLDQLLAESNSSGRLTYSEDPVAAVLDADFVFLCVATPQRDDGAADLRFLEAAAVQVGPALKPGTVVINKSTVPVGSTELVLGWLGRNDVSVVSNPEFLREGTAISDWQNPDRIVVGGDPESAERVMDLYAKLPGYRIVCDAPSSELIKYASNAYLATRLTFVNSLSEICEKLDADVLEVTGAMGLDGRIGSRYLKPGPGWGGSCLPKDTHALAYQAEKIGADFHQLRATILANESHLDRAAQLIVDALPSDPASCRVGVLGMAFKAGTGDTRDSPAINVIKRLLERGLTVKAFDPGVTKAPIEDIEIMNGSVDCARGVDVLVVATEWPEFKDLDFEKISEVMNHKRIVDLRHLLDASELAVHGLDYWTIGSQSLVAL